MLSLCYKEGVQRNDWKAKGLRVARASGGGGLRVPPVSDPRWEAWAKPLLEQLGEPQSWENLRAWARSARVGLERLRHQLAWLETVGRAWTFYRDEQIYWTATGSVKAPHMSTVRVIEPKGLEG